MPKYPKDITLNQDEVSQTINVADYLGASIADRPRIIQEFGQAVVDRILDRTAKKKDYFGAKFDGYSEEYIESEDFKEYDKKKSDINMTLTGDMLDSIDFEQKDTNIIVSVGDDQTAKAYNHAVGDTLPQRAFFGVTKKEMKSIAAKFDIPKKQTRRELIDLEAVAEVRDQSPREIFGELFKEFDIDFQG